MNAQDSFYKKHTPEEVALAFASRFDLDHPDSIDMDLFASVSAAVLSLFSQTTDLILSN